jgi:hypothetical protein
MARAARKNVIEDYQNVPNVDFESHEWEFEGVFVTKRNGKDVKYNLSIPAKVLGLMYTYGVIKYNPNIQRGEKLDNKGNLVDIHRVAKVKSIKRCMENDTLHGGTIILNANPEICKIEYDLKDFTLRGKGVLEIVDGNHRLRAIRDWVKEFIKAKGKSEADPADYEMPIQIEVLPEIESASVFAEYCLLPLKISKTRGMFHNVHDISNIITREIMRDSQLRNKIETIGNQPKGNNIVTFGVITGAINDYIKPKTKEQGESITKYLIKFVDSIVNTFPDVMGSNIDNATRQEIRKQSLVIEPMFWESYLALFNDMFELNQDEVSEKLGKLKNRVKIEDWEGNFLDRNNPIWQNNIMINGKIINKRSTKKFTVDTIRNYVLFDKLPEMQ